MDCDEIETEATKNMKEKTADEMLKELGYKKLPKKFNKNMILYEKKEVFATNKTIIFFSLSDRRIQFSNYVRYPMQELQAINKKCKELRLDLRK